MPYPLSSMSQADFTQNLQNLMQKVGFASFKSLSLAAGVSQWQILQLRRGKIRQMRVEVLLKISQVLQISGGELAETFGVQGLSLKTAKTQREDYNIDLLQQIDRKSVV